MAKRNRIFYYHSIAVIISIIITFLTLRHLFINDPSIIVEYRDVVYPPSKDTFLQGYRYMWSDYGSCPSFERPARAWLFLWPILSTSIEMSSRIDFSLCYLVMFLMPYFSFFYLAKKFLKFNERKSFLSSIIFALLYSFNPYTIQAYSPPYTYVISYSLLPALVTSTLLVLNKDNFASKLLLALVVTATITPIIRYVSHVFTIVVLVTLFYYAVHTPKSSSSLIRIGKKFTVVASILFLFNFYWLFPIIFSSGSTTFQPSYVLNYETTLMFSKAYKMYDVFALKASWWPYLQLKPLFWDPLWYLLLFTIPILTSVSLLRWKSYKKEEKSLLMIGAILFVIGISLWKGLDNTVLFSKIYESLLFSTPSFIGWMFRVPEYFGTLAVLGSTLCIGIMIGNILSHNSILSFSNKSSKKREYTKYMGVDLALFLVLTSTVISWQRVTGDLDGILRNGYYQKDRAYFDELDFKRAVVMLDEYEGDFKPHHIGKPYITLPNDLTKYFLNRIKENDVGTVTYLMWILGSDALITNKDLENLPYSQKILADDIIVYLLDPALMKIVYVPESVFLESNPRFDHIGSLSKLTNSCQVLPLSAVEHQIFLGDIFINFDPKDLVTPSENTYLISPFDATIHCNPSRVWSKARTNDPLHGDWHSYLEERGIKNWDLDHGKGLVFTWAAPELRVDPTPSIEDLTNQWTFNSENDLDQWKNYTRENQFGALYSLTLVNNALKAELWNSTWGWKTINSPLIPAEYNSWYRWELQIKGENAHGVHMKVIEYNEEKKIITGKQVKIIGSGDFDWQTITIDFTPENPETKYIQLQIWHGHETTQPLPNKILIDNVKIYNLQRFVEPVTLEVPFQIQEADEYIFLIRYLQNQQGGEIQIQLDNKNYTINTKDQLNKFAWKEIDTLNLQKGQHKITLTNLQGFNAINIFALIPKQQYKNAQNQLEQTLQNKRIIYILEAETDLYHENAATSNKYGGEASNGIVLELNQTSKVWNEIEIIKPGNYTLAIRSKGNLTIKIDGKEYKISSPQLNWTYIGPINLEEGKHTIEVTNPMQPYRQWSFENGEPQDWQISAPAIQTLTIDGYAYEGEYSLKAELNASTWGWKVTYSPLIPATPETPYQRDFYVAGENARAVHVKIAEYDINKTLLSDARMPGGGSGNFTWANINFDYTPSQNASFIQLQIWHGHETTQPLPNKVWIDNVKVYDLKDYQPSDLDVVWLYSTQNENETLEDIFKSEENPAQIIGYQKIDPTKYAVKVNATKPFMLSFAEAYDPLWVSYVNGEKISSIPLYGVINGFWINKTGELTITIEFEVQRWFYYGSAVSIISLLGSVAYLVWDWYKKSYNGSVLQRTISWLRKRLRNVCAGSKT